MVLRIAGGARDHDDRNVDQLGDRGELPQRIEGIGGGQMRVDHQRAGRGNRQRVAIGGGFRCGDQPERAAGARLVDDYDLAVEAGAELRCKNARDAVGRAARSERHVDLHGFGGGLRRPRARQHRQHECGEQHGVSEAHFDPPGGFCGNSVAAAPVPIKAASTAIPTASPRMLFEADVKTDKAEVRTSTSPAG
jgi:hypothetical protein